MQAVQYRQNLTKMVHDMKATLELVVASLAINQPIPLFLPQKTKLAHPRTHAKQSMKAAQGLVASGYMHASTRVKPSTNGVMSSGGGGGDFGIHTGPCGPLMLVSVLMLLNG